MRTILLATLATVVLAAVPADAASRHGHKHHHAAAPAVVRTAPAPALNRPVWASPYECYTDEGYGRFWPCGAGKSD